MSVRRILIPLVWLAILSGAGYAAYATHERWVPYVFPTTKVADNHPPSDDHGHDHDHPPEVKLSPQAVANLKLVVGPIRPQAYWRTALIPGVVIDRPGENDRGVTARLTGVITDIKATPGEVIGAGAPLFHLQPVSEVLQGAQSELAKAAKELSLVTANRDRIAQQVNDGVVPRSNLIEPENQVKRASNQVQGVRRQLQAFGLSPAQLEQAEKGEYVTEVVVSAPPAASLSATDKSRPSEYEVQDLKVMLGETVQGGHTLCTLSDHSRLYVEGRAFESEVGSIRKLAEAALPVRGEFSDDIPGEWSDLPPLVVRNLSNVVDHATHTFAFYLTLDNQSRRYERDGKTHRVWRFRPGQHVRLRVPLEKLGDDVLVLPSGAVVREGPEAYAFVQKGDAYVRTPVRVLYEDRTEVVLANDGSLGPKAQVVKNQAAALNRAVKAAEGGDHGHDHDH